MEIVESADHARDVEPCRVVIKPACNGNTLYYESSIQPIIETPCGNFLFVTSFYIHIPACMSKTNDARLTSVPENGPELAAQRRLHQHVDILPVLEGFVQPATWNCTVLYCTVEPATWNNR